MRANVRKGQFKRANKPQCAPCSSARPYDALLKQTDIPSLTKKLIHQYKGDFRVVFCSHGDSRALMSAEAVRSGAATTRQSLTALLCAPDYERRRGSGVCRVMEPAVGQAKAS